VDDVRALAGWDFELDQIRVPIHLWHGNLDKVIPLSHARHLASVIPKVTLTICPGEGHMLMWNHLPQILRVARGEEGSDRSDPYDLMKTPGEPARSRVA
jgi:pimeloyl-ACP methyl ester carboxylesterase